MSVSDQAFVTLATDDISCQGALVLGQSLRNHGTSRKLVVLLSPQVSGLLRVLLSRVFDEVVEVNLMDSADYVHLVFLKRPELGVTLSKLHCWTLTHYSKCVFLDADTLVLANVDELFDRGELSAAPDPGWPDCFNSGVFVFQPSLHTHRQLLRHAGDHGSFDGGDQGLLNSFFSGWPTADIHTHLPFVYNLSSSSAYTYGPAFQRFGSCAKVVRFLGPTKPWNYRFNAQTGSVEDGLGLAGRHQLAFLNLWWRTYQRAVLPLYQRLRDEDEGPCPAPTVCLSVVGVPWENSAPSEEGRRASSGTASSQPWPDEEPVDRTSLVEEPPASQKDAISKRWTCPCRWPSSPCRTRRASAAPTRRGGRGRRGAWTTWGATPSRASRRSWTGSCSDAGGARGGPPNSQLCFASCAPPRPREPSTSRLDAPRVQLPSLRLPAHGWKLRGIWGPHGLSWG